MRRLRAGPTPKKRHRQKAFGKSLYSLAGGREFEGLLSAMRCQNVRQDVWQISCQSTLCSFSLQLCKSSAYFFCRFSPFLHLSSFPVPHKHETLGAANSKGFKLCGHRNRGKESSTCPEYSLTCI